MEDSSQSEEPFYVPPIKSEFEGVNLRDLRLHKRLIKIVEGIAPAPHKSLPQAAATKNDLHATYRFLSNDSIRSQALVQPHIEQTVKRCEKTRLVIVAHDTTEVEYEGDVRREGLGYLRSEDTQGFLAHVSLALSGDGTQLPLGVLAVHAWTRDKLRHAKTKHGRRLSGSEYAKIENKETKRWGQQVSASEAAIGSSAQLLHVMDREADAFPLLDQLISQGNRFVVRATHDRSARDDARASQERMRTLMARAEGVLEVTVRVSSRRPNSKPKNNKSFPARESRCAKLVFSAKTVQLKRPQGVQGEPWLTLNVVHVTETEVPEGVQPIEWYLYTTEPVDTPEQVAAVVDYYRARWVIEEFFKALKTGCSLEDRQLESYQALTNALSLFIPMAWQMLLLRTLARSSPNAPAETVLSSTQVEVLRTCGSQPLPPKPTANDVLKAVAILGGYIPNKRGPGWLVLGRGMEKLLLLESGWTAARLSPTKGETYHRERCAES